MSEKFSISDQVDTGRLMAHMQEVARWTKVAGTPTELESLEYFERELAQHGFRVERIVHDAYISIPGQAKMTAGGINHTCITHSFGRPTQQSGLTAELVYVGNGKDEDFARVDVTGKIVVSHGLAAPEIAVRASKAGASGQIQITTNDKLYEMCISPIWGSPSASHLEQLPTTVVVSISRPDGLKLIEAIESGQAQTATINAEVDTSWRATPILVAELEAPEAVDTDQFVILSGHHDTWYYGVMDNGGANATMMEVARLAIQHRDQWRRGLRLCFWSGHSQGRYSGSAWYADTYWDELEQHCVAHVNVDSTGGSDATQVHTTAAMSCLRHLAVEAIGRFADQTYTGKRRGRSGDDSFGGIGVPSMFGPISEQDPSKSNGRRNLGWWWHTPEDLLDKISPENLVRDTQVVGHAVWRLLSDEILPIDFLSQIQDLETQLGKMHAVRSVISLDAVDTAIAELRSAATALAGAEIPVRRREAVNTSILRATRALVPLDYTSGDRFAHEPAVPVPAWPTLEPLRRLADNASGVDAPFFAVDAVRACNRLKFCLRQAAVALRSALED